MTNPYAWNQINVDVVYGRTRLINELLSGLPSIPPISFALTGGRRMGKSTLLRLVEQEIKSSAGQWAAQDVLVAPIYIDGLSLPRPLYADGLWGRVIDGITAQLGQSVSTQSATTVSYEAFTEKTRDLLGATSRAVRVIILFDEIEPVLAETWADGYFANWRSLLSNTPGLSPLFAAVFSGAQELVRLRQDIGSPLMDILELRSLKNLSFEDSRLLMEEPISTNWDDLFCQYVFGQTGGQPMLVQYFMQAVCSRPEGMSALDAAHAARERFLENRSWQFNDWWYKHCSPMAQAVYRRLPDGETWISLQDLVREYGTRAANDALEILQHVGIAVSSADGLSFRRAGEMFSSWQKAKGVATPTPNHDLEIYSRLTKLDTEYAKKYASAWAILAADLPNYSGAVSEMRDTLTLILHRLAPDNEVMQVPEFSLEAGQNRPTRRQRARHIAMKNLLSTEQAKALVGDVDIFEFHCGHIAQSVSTAYGMASSLTHTTSTRDLAYQSLKQGDSILAQLLQ